MQRQNISSLQRILIFPVVILASIFLIVLGISLVIFLFLFAKERAKQRILGSFDMALFLVLMPKYEIDKEGLMQKQEKELIGHMEQVYANFLYLHSPGWWKQLLAGKSRVAFEIASQTGGSDIEFYVAVPKYMESSFENYIQGIYPRAVVEPVPNDYTIFEPESFTTGAIVKLSEPSILPLQTYRNLEKDPLASITNSLGQIAQDEGAAVQIIISPISQSKWQDFGDKMLSNIREGKSLKNAISEETRSLAERILLGIIGGITQSGKKKEDEQKEEEQHRQKLQEMKIDQRMTEAIQSKLQKQAFETNIRLVASAKTQQRADEILGHLAGVFSQFGLSSLNSLEVVTVKKNRLKDLIFNYSFRVFVPSHKNVLNIEELTSIYHFPTRYIETPYIKSATSSSFAPPPAELPLAGKGLNTIGKVHFRGEDKQVSFGTRNDRRRHFYVIGQTGTGKSSLLQEMIRQDIQNGEGVAVVDPHGELVEATLSIIPPERMKDVVLFEPFDTDRPMGLNMLEYETPEQKDFAVQEMIAIFQKLFPPEVIGPMFEHYMRNAMLALMADQNNLGTLVEIPRMFTDDEFMSKQIAMVQDPIVRSFWLREWKQTTGGTKSEMLGYVVSKIGRFIENEMLRNIIGQQHSAFDLADIMNGRKIFLANLSKGRTGEVNSALLGLILVSKIQMAAMKRAAIAEDQRSDFYLYIDEFQNFTTDSIATILSEARKYRLNLIMAHQYIPQLTNEIKDAVLGNVGSMGVFRVGADDAEFLEKQFRPEFSRFDLVNLPNFHLIAKIMIDNKVYRPFQMQTIVPVKGNMEQVESLKQQSKTRFGRRREMVEEEIASRMKF
ncbi:MAG: hypothetical protein A3C04_03580 [Candidatus Wildermuthbacteria bacterium RIFCSPHIGHO2_02_FULL_45_25]|uniref:Uncharacterized protein n=1 Tax=Candidatus Wildermuthbacteria bacterium RIFCSPHIGHO2_02_FULL_45_25 TaxID=1802450 RepID=A0A1G2R0L6_9BACT|nr:MAG: hypothetical protein A3C04_03580 [Candidatus Wildermuthbacteria bacterium RIFCSPHIGHO2_02_FULL_45_25]